MNELAALAEFALERAVRVWSGEGVRTSVLCTAVVLAVVVAFEAATGRDWRRYFSPHGRTDALYAVFYVGGFYSFLFSRPVNGALRSLAAGHGLPTNVVAELPVGLQVVVVVLVMDLFGYWAHRALHALPVLWAFHRIHHSQRRLNVLTNFRFHFVDVTLFGLATFVPGLVLNAPREAWVPASAVVLAVQLLAHSGLDQGFGPLDRVLVSPRFHAIHHSTEARHQGLNFGMLFTLWDRLFGTALDEPAPRSTGTVDAVPESFLRQAVHPFVELARRGGRP